MPGRIFISYSYQDEKWKNRVVKQLKVLAPNGLEVWDDRRIAGGDAWQAEIEQAMAACDAALLLISANFLTSPFILREIVPALMQRYASGGITVIPLIVSPCQWTRLTWLSHKQARPLDGKALTSLTEINIEMALANLADEIEEVLKACAEPLTTTPGSSQLNSGLHHFPAGAPNFLGRDQELAMLNQARASGSNVTIVQIIGPGGTGKTALLCRWLDIQSDDSWGGGEARQVFGWSFYSQGAPEDSQASEGPFLEAALKGFGVQGLAPNAHAHDKGVAIAQAVIAQRSLLVLDGLEPLQHPPGPQAGQLRAPGIRALLETLALGNHRSLCLISSRAQVTELNEWCQADGYGRAQVLHLSNLSLADGALLLYRSGATYIGNTPIPETLASITQELLEISENLWGHAFTLCLLGGYLSQAYQGNVQHWRQVGFSQADAEQKDGHAFKVISAYEYWFAHSGEQNARCLAVLRLLSFFDRPAPVDLLAALRHAPAIEGLSENLQDLTSTQWGATLKHLRTLRLLETSADKKSLNTHPLLREYFAHTLQSQQPDAWREGHRRIYEYLKTSTAYQPDGIEGLQPLYQAVRHGCQAGLYKDAFLAVYIVRIQRGLNVLNGGLYSTKQLGAYSDNLGAVACFFSQPWKKVVPDLPVEDQAWLLNGAAFSLSALGRLEEAIEPMCAGAQLAAKKKHWGNAAAGCNNLCELQLLLGHTAEAADSSARSIEYATLGCDAWRRLTDLATQANTLQQRAVGEQTQNEQALLLFEKAEALQRGILPDTPLLYSASGFYYGEALLAPVEWAVWQDNKQPSLVAVCDAVMERAHQTLKWAVDHGFGNLDIALGHLTLARCALYRDLLNGLAPGIEAHQQAHKAVNGLRQSGRNEMLPKGLLTRAWLHFAAGETEAAQTDLAEAQRIAKNGKMRLYLVDIALMRAKFLRDDAALITARQLIDECGYGRRIPFWEALNQALSA